MKLASLLMVAAAVALAPGIATAKQSKKHHVVRIAEPGHIACTRYGCFPVPSNCRPHTQLNWWGNPTGYDAVTCR
jgi:hypothetical protein